LGNTLTTLDRIALVHEQTRTVGHTMDRTFLARSVEDQDSHITAHHHEVAIGVANHIAVTQLNGAFIRSFEIRAVNNLCGTTQVEGTHGELSARFTDRLSSDNTDRFALVDRSTACKVATIALGADAVAGFAGQGRADADRLDTSLLDDLDVLFLDHAASLDDDFAGCRMQDRIESRTAQTALADRSHNLTGIDDR